MDIEESILGLQWVKRWTISNGYPDSCVVPFATSFPVNIVTHGDQPFDYGQYGVHLGQQDSLTFLGDPNQLITARFIDCRKQSATFRKQLDLVFFPSSSKTLVIPPGVAHTFNNLGGVTTLNDYRLFLPSAGALADSEPAWTPENDIINLPLNTDTQDLEGFTTLTEPAAPEVYFAIARHQTEHLQHLTYAHSETRAFTLGTGEQITLRLREKISPATPHTLPASSIPGVRFIRRPGMQTGPHSAIIPLPGPSPFYLVEHGQQPYDFDSYGIHLGQEDHLIFFAPDAQQVQLKLVDMRRDSNTLHKEETLSFECASDVELVIPCGVAHALSNLRGVQTLNRPRLFLKPGTPYRPGDDIIDWPLDKRPFPTFDVNSQPATHADYQFLVEQQCELMQRPASHSTPKALYMLDEQTGEQVKVLIKTPQRSPRNQP